MQTLLIATTNPGKLHELRELLFDLPVLLTSLKEVGIQTDVEETGSTFLENSLLKARFYAGISKLPTISDDGGLLISALNGAPGVKSRRWLGYDASDEVLFEHMKNVAKSLPDDNRDAQFRTVITFALPDSRSWSEEGNVNGIIAKEPYKQIVKGYPYRSFFFLPDINKFYFESELSKRELKKYNHRYIALHKLKPVMRKYLLHSSQ